MPGRRFSDSRDLEGQWYSWLHTIADIKPNETTGEAPAIRLELERPNLNPLRDSIYSPKPAFKEHPVYPDGFVKVLGNRYSVPWQYHRQKVSIRIRDVRIDIHDLDGALIYSHERCFEKGKKQKVRWHYRRPHSESTEELSAQMLVIYGDSQLLEELKIQFPRHYREQCQQLLRLADRYDPSILKHAAHTLLLLGGVCYSKIKQAASHLHQRAYAKGLEQLELSPCREIPDLDLEQRSCDYYDDAMEVRS